jgi:hypothetical protein
MAENTSFWDLLTQGMGFPITIMAQLSLPVIGFKVSTIKNIYR